MKRKWLTAAAVGVMLVTGSVTVSMAEEPAAATGTEDTFGAGETEGRWQQDAGKWMYGYEDGTYVISDWRKLDGHWYYFDRDGRMAAGWTKIGNYDYCFLENGELVSGWCFDDVNEKWHYFGEDGNFKRGWFQDTDGTWYWFNARGEMASDGYKTIEGARYYFFENGEMAANQYVGLYYMDENGRRNNDYDILVEGKKKESSISGDIKDEITQELGHIPREWIKYFVDHGWRFMYYSDKDYFSAPDSGSGPYYVYHKLDTSYRKIKFTRADALVEAFGEYMGYVSNCYGNSDFILDLEMSRRYLDDLTEIPDYYANDTQFYFGKLMEAYLLDEGARAALEADSPSVCEMIRSVLESQSAEPDREGLQRGRES